MEPLRQAENIRPWGPLGEAVEAVSPGEHESWAEYAEHCLTHDNQVPGNQAWSVSSAVGVTTGRRDARRDCQPVNLTRRTSPARNLARADADALLSG
jgi:hypothetical protein